MASVVFIKNPFDPLRDAQRFDIAEGQTIHSWLRKQYPGWQNFEQPTLCLFNGEPIKRWRWKRTKPKKEDDVVTFVTMPGDPLTLLYIAIGAIIVAAVVVAIMPKLSAPNTGDPAEADPVYTLRGQRNQIRLGMPIESVYGAPRIWPSYAAQPYNQYRDNKQWLYQLFSLGHGTFDITEKRFEDTNIEDFLDVEVEVVPPGGTVTLFPTNVVTAAEVAGLELYGPNEPEGTGGFVEDSPGDPTADPPIEPTGHYVWSMAGPYVANPANTEANTIECDITFPRGLYRQNDNGTLSSIVVTVLFEMRLIDAAGNPLGDWETMETVTKDLATTTPQRFTVVRVVPFGRYQVRASRTTNKDTSTRAGNVVMWEALRTFLNTEQNWGDVTLIAVKARATDNLNDSSAQRFNVLATRKLPIWDVATQTWSAPTATRNPVWAFCDIFRSAYGGRIADQYLDLDNLATMAAVYATDGWTFDWVFDQRMTVWEAARAVAQAGRAVPMLNGSRITMVKDVQLTVPTAVFNQENIVKGSFRWEIKLWGETPHDGVRVTYVDPTTWKEETVLCCLAGETGEYPEDVTLQGVTNREQAFVLGMYRRASQRYTRENIVFTTGLEGHCPSYGDLIAVSHDVPRWGQAGLVLGESQLAYPSLPGVFTVTLTLSEDIVLDGAVNDHRILIRSRTGAALGPFNVSAVVGARTVKFVTNTALYWQTFDYSGDENLPLFLFGKLDQVGMKCRVVGLAPAADDTVQITAVNHDARVYGAAGDPPEEEPGPQVPATPALPWVTGLRVNTVPESVNEVLATWFPSRGAQYYIIQLSYDSQTWETINDNFKDTSIRFSVKPGTLRVRVAAVNKGQGPWAYWVGAAPVDGTNVVVGTGVTPDPVTSVVVTAGFGSLWVEWVNPTNARLKNIHIYMAPDTTLPGAPTFTKTAEATWHVVSGLADNITRNFWLVAESVDGLFSTPAGPFAGTTTNGITLSHLIPGGLQPIELVTVIPSTGNYKGRMVFLTAADAVGTDYVTGQGFVVNKVYRWDGAGTFAVPVAGKNFWTANVPTVDLSGVIVSGQIADNAILQAKLADNAVSTAKLQDALITTAKLVNDAVTEVKVATGAITTTKITDNAITTAKITAGAITTGKIAAGAITANEIAANTITAAKIQAGSITATEIAANTITAAKIFAGTITANELAANSVIAAKIQAGAIEADKIAANAVTAAKIDADAVTAGKIQAGAITATAIGTNEIITNSANIANGVITNAKIVSLEAGKISAGTISASISITAPTINGGIITGAALIISSPIGLRYTNDSSVYTITGGSDNGPTHGAQIDLAGNSLPTYGGALVLAAGDVSGSGRITLRTHDLERVSVEYNGDVTVQQNFQALSLYATSSRRYKKNIRAITEATRVLERLQGVTHDWRVRRGQAKRPRSPGLIAEQVNAVLPSVVRKVKGQCESVDYTKIVPYLIAGWQEHQQELKALRKEVKELRRGK